MTVDANSLRKVVEAFYQDVWNRHDKSMIPELLCPDIKFRGSLGQYHVGHAGFTGYLDEVHAALEAYHCEILDLVIEEAKVFARMRFMGIHRGELLGYAPTGKRIEWAGAALFLFKENKIADLWVLGDVHGVLADMNRQREKQ